jgi:hypothetical protein
VVNAHVVAHENTHTAQVTAHAGNVFALFAYIFKVLKNLLLVDNVVYRQFDPLLNDSISFMIILLAALDALVIESQYVLLL